jgi:hypothetical protein
MTPAPELGLLNDLLRDRLAPHIVPRCYVEHTGGGIYVVEVGLGGKALAMLDHEGWESGPDNPPFFRIGLYKSWEDDDPILFSLSADVAEAADKAAWLINRMCVRGIEYV